MLLEVFLLYEYVLILFVCVNLCLSYSQVCTCQSFNHIQNESVTNQVLVSPQQVKIKLRLGMFLATLIVLQF